MRSEKYNGLDDGDLIALISHGNSVAIEILSYQSY